jgi:hypothetical protein
MVDNLQSTRKKNKRHLDLVSTRCFFKRVFTHLNHLVKCGILRLLKND